MKKVLIIEDNDDIREGTAEMLDLAGYETYTAKIIFCHPIAIGSEE